MNFYKIIFYALLTLIYCFTPHQASSQTNPIETSNLDGIISLDTGVATADYVVEITVSSHRLVINTFPFFFISYPVIDTFSTKVTIPQGAASASYRVSNINVASPKNFSIKMECPKCKNVIANQYHTSEGNDFRFSGDVVINGNVFPDQLNLNLATGFSISGNISIAKGIQAPRDIELQVIGTQVIEEPIFIQPAFFQSEEIILAAGENSISYQFGAFRPDQFGNLEVKLICKNCEGIGPKITELGRLLPLGRNSFGADFVLKNNIDISAIITLLLLQE